MKDKFGFTVREHTFYIPDIRSSANDTISRKVSEIHLDFYSEHKRTMFLLKFGDMLTINAEKD